jgi:hypothetical protein
MSLVVFRPPAQAGSSWRALEVCLDPVLNRTGDAWHVALSVPGDLATACYAWRVDGDVSWESGNRFDPSTLLLDPHAPLLRVYPGLTAGELPGLPAALPALVQPEGAPAGVASSLAALAGAAAPAATPQPLGLPLEGMAVLELDVRTFAQGEQAAMAVVTRAQPKRGGGAARRARGNRARHGHGAREPRVSPMAQVPRCNTPGRTWAWPSGWGSSASWA